MTQTARNTLLQGLVIMLSAGCFTACSNDAQQAEYTVPDSELNVAVTVKKPEATGTQPQRIVQAREGNKELFSAQLEPNKTGNTKARLYKQQDKEYVLVDDNGDRYQLNFRDKRFEKTDAGSASGDTGKYIGKFDYDKENTWSFIPGKPRKQNGAGTKENTVATDGNGKRSFGPPSKNF